jgi:hypothetical protein
MQYERWKKLMESHDESLTDEELSAGWHWCYDWDGLLVGPGMQETEHCHCGVKFVNPDSQLPGRPAS